MNEKEQLEEYAQNNILCAITFQITPKGQIELVAFWDEAAQPVDMFAELLHNLTSGQINAHIVKSLLEIANTQPESAMFIMSILGAWKNIVRDKEVPLCNPTKSINLTKGK